MAIRPPVHDTVGIVDEVRRHGSVHYPIESVPGDFILWRRKIREEAKRTGMRVSVIRSSGLVLVHNPDHEETDEEMQASADVMGGLLTGEHVTYEEALRKRARQRLRLVRNDE